MNDFQLTNDDPNQYTVIMAAKYDWVNEISGGRVDTFDHMEVDGVARLQQKHRPNLRGIALISGVNMFYSDFLNDREAVIIVKEKNKKPYIVVKDVSLQQDVLYLQQLVHLGFTRY